MPITQLADKLKEATLKKHPFLRLIESTYP
jgi:hypothetical protein